MAHTNPTPPASPSPPAASASSEGPASFAPFAKLAIQCSPSVFDQGVANEAELLASVAKTFKDYPEVARALLNARDPGPRRFDALILGSDGGAWSACAIADARRRQNDGATRDDELNAAIGRELAQFDAISDVRLSVIIQSFHGVFTEFEKRASPLLWANFTFTDAAMESGGLMDIALQLGVPEIAAAIESQQISEGLPVARISRGRRSL